MQTIRTRSAGSRAQTAQDFVIGLGIFLLAVTFVVGYFPELAVVYEEDSGAQEASIADRAASSILDDVTTGNSQNDVDSAAAKPYFENQLAESNVRSTLTMPDTKFINVTIRTLDRSAVVTIPDPGGPVRLDGGHRYGDQSALTVTRIVTMSDDPGICNPACRIVVRVW